MALIALDLPEEIKLNLDEYSSATHLGGALHLRGFRRPAALNLNAIFLNTTDLNLTLRPGVLAFR